MPKTTKGQVESLRELAGSAVGSFIELGATKDEEAKLKKQLEVLSKSGMTSRDLDYALRTLARDKDEAFMKQLRYARKILML